MKRISVTVLFLGVVTMAQAVTTYTYSGPTFDTFSIPPGSYSATNHVTGSFTVALPLGPNLPATDITPRLLSYKFTDGLQTLDNFNSRNCAPAPAGGFQVSTDSTGRINGWAIILCAPPNPQVNDHFNNVYTTLGLIQVDEDGGQMDLVCIDVSMSVCDAISHGPVYSTGYRPGANSATSWTASTFSTDIPALTESNIALLAALLGLGSLWALRRKSPGSSRRTDS